jgi:hypothetical protein
MKKAPWDCPRGLLEEMLAGEDAVKLLFDFAFV